jgi:hypothetical protein
MLIKLVFQVMESWRCKRIEEILNMDTDFLKNKGVGKTMVQQKE